MKNLTIKDDLVFIRDTLCNDLIALKNASIFITGGTGFIGKWLLESVNIFNNDLNLNITLTVLARNPDSFLQHYPHFKEYHFIDFLQGDISDFKSPKRNFTHLIHAATDASAHLNENNPKKMFDTIVNGTERVFEFAVEQSIKDIIFLSSGAVYGQQPWEMEKISENWNGSLNCTNTINTYAEAKRAAEMLCSIYKKQYGLKISTARIFALIGPYLPLDTHFALGNFINDAIQNKLIVVKGNGLPERSYLYISDLIIWLWKIVICDKEGCVYNVGSDESISIADLAKMVSEVIGNGRYEIQNKNDSGWNLGRYTPNIDLITNQFNVKKTVSLQDAIYKTALANGWKKNNEII